VASQGVLLLLETSIRHHTACPGDPVFGTQYRLKPKRLDCPHKAGNDEKYSNRLQFSVIARRNSNEAIQSPQIKSNWIAALPCRSLAMTKKGSHLA